MTSSAEAKLGALYITSQKVVPMRRTLIEVGWPQPPTPIQTYNTTAGDVVNNTIVTKKWSLWTYGYTAYADGRHKKYFVLLGQRTQQLGWISHETTPTRLPWIEAPPFCGVHLNITTGPTRKMQMYWVSFTFSSGAIYSITARVYCYPTSLHV